MRSIDPAIVERLSRQVNRRRLVETAIRLIEVPSRTGEARTVADRLADILASEGFPVDRPEGGYPEAPAVAVRLDSGRPGRTLQFDGHLDTVHLPFVAPGIVDGRITGSGAADMKGGIAAAVEALRVLRETDALSSGAVLLTTHDLHEAPWGDGRQLDRMIRDGYVGEAVLLPEPLSGTLPVVGRGSSTWTVTIRRAGVPVHEVLRPPGTPSVIAAGAELVARLGRLGAELAAEVVPTPLCGPASVFIGQFHAGEIYNQEPAECRVQGTRRWLPGTDRHSVERDFRSLLTGLASDTGATVECDWFFIRDAFFLDQSDPLVSIFQGAHAALSGAPLAIGPKPFVDDGNSFCSLGRVPAITHGPRAGGQHTTEEWVEIDDLERVARLYALTAASYC
jgi:acetylornithine deacetylase/succinyl-diaminopimelate desuccinylase-like protein